MTNNPINNREKKLEDALIRAKEKLEIYRQHSDGNYQGGVEHTALIKYINEALHG